MIIRPAICICFFVVWVFLSVVVSAVTVSAAEEPAACTQTSKEPCDATGKPNGISSAMPSFMPKVPEAQPQPAEKPSQKPKPFVLHFFEGAGCPHCAEERRFLEGLRAKYPNMKVVEYEVWHNQENAQLLASMAKAHGLQVGGVPVTFVGSLNFVGFSAQKKEELLRMIEVCSQRGCPDPADRLLPEQQGLSPASQSGPGTALDLPFFGKIDAASLSLPVMTVVIAGLDSFNPCAFFVLFSLLGILVHTHSRAKMLLVGGIFIFFSGFVYFLFMAAWLNVFLLLGKVTLITTIAGVVSIGIALINIKDFFWFQEGISLSIPDAAKPKLFDRMRRLLKASSLPSVIGGTVVLALAANSYELLCTAGFPMVFTRILTLHQLPASTYYAYLVLYNIVYVIPLALIVTAFSLTLGKRHLSEWEGRVLKLVSGTMMLGLGVMLVWKPELLNNIVASGAVLGASIAVSALIAAMAKKN